MIQILSEEQEHSIEELFKKELRIKRWEKSHVVPDVNELIDDINHELLVL